MTKQKPIIENFLTWKGLPVALTLISSLVLFIAFLVSMSSRVQGIELQHTAIESHQIRLEEKVDRILFILGE